MPETATHDERRAHPRYKCVKPVEITVVRKTVKGFSIDIGEGGISFILDTMVAPGTVSLALPEIQLVVECRILNAHPADRPGFYRHQAQFKSPLLVAQLEQLLV
ncbi:MAG TPA: PilZ domain-containing protein [Turneriella sp.]|nr:PilZ domain-containing protein [Turneriella sp.]HNL54984.1 PilZ domain-containing protein [Turneriella sp.]